MPRVILTGTLKQLTGGEGELELDVGNVRQLFKALGQRYPALADQLDDGYAVAINGQIFQDDWFAPIAADAEVHVLPKIGGG